MKNKYVISILLLLFATFNNKSYSQSLQFTTLPTPQRYLDNYYSFLTAVAGQRLNLEITGLTQGMQVDLVIKDAREFGSRIIYTKTETISSNQTISTNSGDGGIDLTNGINNNTGIFEIEVKNHLNGLVLKNFSDKVGTSKSFFLVIEKKEIYQMPGRNMKFAIYYTNQFFMNHPLRTTATTYVQYVKDAINMAWTKQVDNWELCKGIITTRTDPVTGATSTVNNMPADADGVYNG